MPVEFLPEDQGLGDPEPPGPGRRSRGPLIARLVGAGTVVALVVVAAVVVTSGGGKLADSSPTSSSSRAAAAVTPGPRPTTLAPATLAVPESAAFGPQSVDVLAVGNRLISLTPTLIGIADRDGGALTVRPTPLGLSNQTGDGKLVLDPANDVVWVVAIGGTAIGAYDLAHLDTVASAVAPYPVRGAVAMDGALGFTTDHGLYTVPAGGDHATRVGGARPALGPVTADRRKHLLLAAGSSGGDQLLWVYTFGRLMRTAELGSTLTSLAWTDGALWATVHSADAPLARVGEDGSMLFSNPAAAVLGAKASVVAAYGDRFLVRGYPKGMSLYCVDAGSGEFKQKWSAPSGATTLNERGVLITGGDGIVTLNARDCLS